VPRPDRVRLIGVHVTQTPVNIFNDMKFILKNRKKNIRSHQGERREKDEAGI
jgi:hypothetical protein